ncbi:MAG: SulP family inorganic anion transporter [Planctomycetes bacterium]|nr:SulP family inorganic anion transporter [Planctomycetota bacterium]
MATAVSIPAIPDDRPGPASGISPLSPLEKPENGWAGLKHWQYDLRSGLMVAMISLPFSMGIAITSGAPPVCGIISAIVAGFLLPFLGGSYVTVSGPAAGLAPAVYTGIFTLGTAYLGSQASHEDVMREGYPLVLVAICIAGILQVLLAHFKVARLCAIFPAAAIEGMLAAIGLMIIVKQLPLLLGQKFEAHEFWEILAEVPQRMSTMNVQVFALGTGCIALLFILGAIPSKLLKAVPPAVWAFFIGTVASLCFLNVGAENLISIPDKPLEHGISVPHLFPVLHAPQTWLPLAYIVFLLLLIDGTESLATIMAVDKLDPYRRRSDPDRTLQAMGVSNFASSMVGGLTIIPGIVKSTANIMGGGRTQWANFYNACFLLIMLIFARDLINLVPKAVLASILVYVGFKLCRPRVWRHVAEIGIEQFAIFTVTVLVTISTDLLIGIVAGVAMKLLLSLWYIGLAARLNGNTGLSTGYLTGLLNLFRNPVGKREFAVGVYDLTLVRPLVCFNLFHVIRELQELPPEVKVVRLHFTPQVTLVDHTTAETLFHYVQDYSSKDLALELVNWERLRPLSNHTSAIQLGLSGELIESEPPRIATV